MNPSLPAPPRYQQVRSALHRSIKEGRYRAGETLPSERELASDFGVARVTIRTALKRLEDEGLLVRAAGRTGARKVSAGDAAGHWPVRGGPLENLMALGRRTRVKLVERRFVPASPRVQAVFGLANDATVLRVLRIRLYRGHPLSYTEAIVPAEFADAMTRESLAETPFLDLIEGMGFRVTTAEQTMHAVTADAEIAAALGIAPGNPLIQVSRVVFDSTGRAVQVFTGWYHPDRYEVHLRLSRVGTETKVWVDSDQIVRNQENPHAHDE